MDKSIADTEEKTEDLNTGTVDIAKEVDKPITDIAKKAEDPDIDIADKGRRLRYRHK